MAFSKRPRSRIWVGALSVGTLLLACNSGRSSTESYSCGDVTRGHCYAASFVGDHVLGFQTRVHVTSNMSPGDGLITNEFWLANYTGTSSWLEVGYKREALGKIKYFWAQNDENGHYSSHDLHDVPPEELDSAVTLTIHQMQRDRFMVSIKGRRTDFAAVTDIHMWDADRGGYARIGQ